MCKSDVNRWSLLVISCSVTGIINNSNYKNKNTLTFNNAAQTDEVRFYDNRSINILLYELSHSSSLQSNICFNISFYFKCKYTELETFLLNKPLISLIKSQVSAVSCWMRNIMSCQWVMIVFPHNFDHLYSHYNKARK